MDSKKFVMSYSGGKDCMLAMYRKIKEGWTPVALITTVKKDSVDSWTHSISKKLLEKASESLNIPIIYVECEMKDYEAKSDDKEFYRIEGKFYEKNKIFEPLKNELKEEGIAVLRTDYTLSDKEFMKIAQEVVEGYGSGELGGYYWLGVIYLTDEEGREK